MNNENEMIWKWSWCLHGGYGVVHINSAQGSVESSCEHSNEPLGSIKDSEFLDHLNDY